jgi:hypothetical protein
MRSGWRRPVESSSVGPETSPAEAELEGEVYRLYEAILRHRREKVLSGGCYEWDAADHDLWETLDATNPEVVERVSLKPEQLPLRFCPSCESAVQRRFAGHGRRWLVICTRCEVSWGVEGVDAEERERCSPTSPLGRPVQRCPQCGGRGIIHRAGTAPPCPHCDGTGYIPADSEDPYSLRDHPR